MNMLKPLIFSLMLACTAAISVASRADSIMQHDNPANLTVIAYHEITQQPSNALITDYAVTPERFEQHLQWLKQNGYHFVGVTDILKAKQGGASLPEKPVLITVDDGYASFYHEAFPIIQRNKIPVVLAVVGSWLQPAKNQAVHFGDETIARDKILSWSELQAMQHSGWVEIASHSFDLHHGIMGNPQGNSEPAAVTRLYDSKTQHYESDVQYQQRIYHDLASNNRILTAHGLAAPRVMVWPYGRYNQQTLHIAQQLGMPLSLSLDDGANQISMSNTSASKTSASKTSPELNRILVEGNMTTQDLAQEIHHRELGLNDNHRPQKIMHVDLDYIYDPDPAQQERNLGHLLDRINAMGVNSVYLQAFSDPDANGSANMVYFPNRIMPMRSDLFNRVAWQIATRTHVNRVYAWMPLLAWELPKNNAVSNQLVRTEQAKTGQHLNMGYIRLSPYSATARQTIREIYQDLAKSSSFNGILFHDDATLSDYEDASPAALKAYAAQGLPTNLAKIRANDALLQKWTAFKVQSIDHFAMQLANDVRQYQPYLLTARNLYAQVALQPYAENWYAQSLEDSLNNYDFTAIMAMPYMEQAKDPAQFYQTLVNRVKQYPNGLQKTVFEIQAINWRNNQPIASSEMAATVQSLYQQGAIHVAYYPDDPIQDHPDTGLMQQAFASKSNVMLP